MMKADEIFGKGSGGDDELQEIEFGASPLHEHGKQTKMDTAPKAGRRHVFNYSLYSKVDSSTDSPDDVKHTRFSCPQTSWQKLSAWNRKMPRCFTATFMIACCVLPMLVIIIVLAVRPQSETITLSSTSASTFADYALTSDVGVVTADNPVCSRIGASMLSRGGNAIDAAIATVFCLGVISPGSSGIGGGCYILLFNQTSGDNHFIDSREVAPQSAHPTMFEGNPMAAQDGGLAVAVLGEVRGLHMAYERFGSGNLAWSDLVAPAAALAEEWTISDTVARTLLEVKTQLLSGEYPAFSALYVTPHTQHIKQAGDTVRQPQLANTLRMIGSRGPDYLYEDMAETLAAEVNDAGGNLTAQDLRNYEPLLTTPLRTPLFNGYEYLGVGSSSSGGAVVAGLLKYMFSFQSIPRLWDTRLYMHRLAEAMKHCFAIRLSLGDPDYVNTTAPLQALLSTAYMGDLALHRSSDTGVQPVGVYGGEFNASYSSRDDHGTSHVSVLDRHGLAVSVTSTVNTFFGSKVVSPSTGVLFNNQMDDFSVPGAENYFHLAPSPYNYPEPGKKPLSSMSPSIVLATDAVSVSAQRPAGRVVLVGGASGGPRIITGTAQVMLNYLARGMDLLSAVVAPRIHTQLLPEQLDVEDQTIHSIASTPSTRITMPNTVFDFLENVVHQPNVTWIDGSFSITQFIAVDADSGLRTAVCDPRKGGKPAKEQTTTMLRRQ